MSLETLQIIWFFLIGVLFAGYSILDGFDLGIGSLLPFLSKEEKDTRILFNAIGPVWDGNEVWLLTAGGALFAAFPQVYATVFSGFYLALMLVLFALIFRAVSIEFWFLDEKWRSLWQKAFMIGSLLPSLLFGVALGNVIIGLPLADNLEYAGSFITLLNPFSLLIGVLGFCAILLQGSTYTSLKTTGELRERARNISEKIWLAYAGILLVALIVASLLIPESRNPITWLFSGLIVASLITNRVFINLGKDGLAFLTSSLAFCGLWGITGSLLFPALVRSTKGLKYSLTIYNSSSGQLTLQVMLVIALIGMPLVIGYSIYVHRIFKGKVEP